MKKISFFAMTAIAVVFGFSACQSEVDPFEEAGKTATIDLNITSDDAMQSRATQTANNADWFAKVGDGSMVAANTITGTAYTPGTYTIAVANFATEADAYTTNEGAGVAYYTVTRNDVALVKGTNTVEFNCGTAKNSKVSVNWTGTADVAGLAVTNVVAAQSAKSRSYTYTAGGDAFFYAGADVVCTINYKYNGVDKQLTKTITTPAAATAYALNISANSNGTITTLTINYDDAMTAGDATTVTFDAATGEEVQP